MIDFKLPSNELINLSVKYENKQFQSEEKTADQITTADPLTMNKTSRSFAEKRIQNTSTPVSTFSRSSKKMIKQEPTIEDIYNDVRVKIGEMEQTFKSENMERERQMLKTYVKILDKIGAEVMTAKQKYLNLDKEDLKTDKRLQIVTELNRERQQCNILTKNIKKVREQIKKQEDEKNYLEKEVEALEEIAQRKKSVSKSEHEKYRSSKQKAKSLQKRWAYTMKENDRLMTVAKRTLQTSGDKFDIKTRTKSFMLKSQEPEAHASQTQQGKHNSRPQTQQNYLGSRRRKIYFNKAHHDNVELSEQA